MLPPNRIPIAAALLTATATLLVAAPAQAVTTTTHPTSSEVFAAMVADAKVAARRIATFRKSNGANPTASWVKNRAQRTGDNGTAYGINGKRSWCVTTSNPTIEEGLQYVVRESNKTSSNALVNLSSPLSTACRSAISRDARMSLSGDADNAYSAAFTWRANKPLGTKIPRVSSTDSPEEKKGTPFETLTFASDTHPSAVVKLYPGRSVGSICAFATSDLAGLRTDDGVWFNGDTFTAGTRAPAGSGCENVVPASQTQTRFATTSLTRGVARVPVTRAKRLEQLKADFIANMKTVNEYKAATGRLPNRAWWTARRHETGTNMMRYGRAPTGKTYCLSSADWPKVMSGHVYAQVNTWRAPKLLPLYKARMNKCRV